MTKFFNTIAVLLFFAALMIPVTSCSKDDSKSSGGTPISMELDGTEWSWQESTTEHTGVYQISVSFSMEYANMQVWDMSTGVVHHISYVGSYDYSDGQGTMSLSEYGSAEMVPATFSIDGNVMTLNYNNATYSLAKGHQGRN